MYTIVNVHLYEAYTVSSQQRTCHLIIRSQCHRWQLKCAFLQFPNCEINLAWALFFFFFNSQSCVVGCCACSLASP